ncbi:MAG: pilus (MSHA type) biogenesis protein MshL [Betaproteobacteria bacterium RIFCSPLOWO2_02_FULL_67_26]|nr:MAG: pilus (MSHA type) biogenesis protein MshL [Betaproteobacteria bacterium RIFCSPLOWO2_02_FULL_67_26]
MKRRIVMVVVMVAAAGCAEQPARRDATYERISAEIEKAVKERTKPVAPDSVSQALLPPLVVEMPRADGKPLDQRFDLNVNNAPAAQVFMAIVSGTRYSMIVHPEVRDSISVNLKDVTVLEALETLRDLYGYEYRVQGNRISVLPVTMQTRVFQVNYLQAQRAGRSEVRVSSGSITDTGGASSGAPPTAGAPAPTSRATESVRVTTSSESNFWGDIAKSLTAIVGSADGRSVIVNSQSGVIVVRALPAEQRSVESFLKAMQLIVERQVVLEAKIIDVSLKDSYGAGINWAAFRSGGTSVVGGVVRPNTSIGNTGPLSQPTGRAPDGTDIGFVTATLGAAASLAADAAVQGGVFGLALQTSNFAALLTFLETQGAVNVLSSPRVATINNQKAVLKVGTDDYFVTNVSTTSTTSGTQTTVTPTITVQPFFSGISLDVTPQIDEHNNIILHIHPQVSTVIEKRKDVNLGNLGTVTLPLASSNINETDTIVRVQDGNIVAIGGLMRQETKSGGSQVPGLGDAPGIGGLFRQRAMENTKNELVILLKPTIVHSDRNWQKDVADTRDRLRALEPPPVKSPFTQ